MSAYTPAGNEASGTTDVSHTDRPLPATDAVLSVMTISENTAEWVVFDVAAECAADSVRRAIE